MNGISLWEKSSSDSIRVPVLYFVFVSIGDMLWCQSVSVSSTCSLIVWSSVPESFGIDLSGGSGLMAIAEFIMVSTTMSLILFPGILGRGANFGPKRESHYIAVTGTARTLGFGNADCMESNTTFFGDNTARRCGL